MKRGLKEIIVTTLIVMLIFSMIQHPTYASSSDTTGHWAEEEIQNWITKGILSGYEDGTIRPNQSITRSEFFTMINRIFGFSEKKEITYTDVNQDAWYYGEIQKAQGAGYISGYLDHTIRPVQPIDRQEAATILFRVFDIEESNSGEILHEFKDVKSISSWSKQAIAAMVEQQYIKGYPDNSFQPSKAITRAEAVKMLDNIIGEIFNIPGDYQTTAQRNVVINHPGVTLHDTVIQGNLYLLEGIGEGDVILDHVTVVGETIIRGGGENSIHIKDSKLTKVIVDKKNGKIRIVAKGNSEVGNVQLKSGAKLEEELDENAQGFGTVETTIDIPEGTIVEFVGEFDEVKIDTENIEVKLSTGTIRNLNVFSNANVEVGKEASIRKLLVSAAKKVHIQGEGKIEVVELVDENAQITADGSMIQQPKESNTTKSDNKNSENGDDENKDENDNADEDAKAVADAKAALELGDLAQVTGDLGLPDTGLHDTIITWTSSNLEIIRNDGAVTRPSYGAGDVQVTLTALIQKGSAQATKDFIATVLRENPSNNASLSQLLINGEPLEGFEPEQLDYEITVPSNSTVPEIRAITEDANAIKEMILPTDLPGEVRIRVTAEDGVTTKNYSVIFNVEAIPPSVNVTASVDVETGIITVAGKVEPGQAQEVTIKLINRKENKEYYVNQSTSSTNGSYKFKFTLKEEAPLGIYDVYIGGTDVGELGYTTLVVEDNELRIVEVIGDLNDVIVKERSSIEDLNLPTVIEAVYSDGIHREVAIIFDITESELDLNTAGTYQLTGYVVGREDLTVSLNVVVKEITVAAITVSEAVYSEIGFINIGGNISTGIGQEVTIIVTDQEGNIDYLNQITSGLEGVFRFKYLLKEGSWGGDYKAMIGGTNVATPVTAVISVPTADSMENQDASVYEVVYDVNGRSATVEFDINADAYTIQVDETVDNVKLTVKLANENAKIRMVSDITVAESVYEAIYTYTDVTMGVTEFVIHVTAADGITMDTYKLKVQKGRLNNAPLSMGVNSNYLLIDDRKRYLSEE